MDYTNLKLTDPYSQHAFVYSIISAISTAASCVPFQIMRSTKPSASAVRRRERMQDKIKAARKTVLPDWQRKRSSYSVAEGDYTPVESGPLYELFRSPNPTISHAQLWEITAGLYQLEGECFWVLEGKNGPLSPNEVPTEIWPMSGKLFTYEKDPETQTVKTWFLKVKDAYGVEQTIPYEPFQIIQFKKPNPSNPIRGLAPLEAAMSTLRQDFKAAIYNESFFDNSGDPGGVIEHQGELTQEQANKIRRVWEDTHAGQGKAFRVAILHSGAKYTVTGNTHTEMQFLEQRKWSLSELLAIWHVPKIVVGITDQVNYASSITEFRLFWQGPVLPMLNYFEDTILARLFVPLTSEDEFGIFDVSDVEALREDLTAKTDIAVKLFNIGFTRNQVNERLDLGFDPSEEGDIAYLPSSLVPAGGLDASYLQPDPNSGDAAPSPPPVDNPSSANNNTPNDSQQSKTRSAGGPIWRRRLVRVLVPGEKLFLGKMKRYLYQLRAEELHLIEQADAKRSIAKTRELSPDDLHLLLFDKYKWDAKLKNEAQPAYQSIMKTSWVDAAEAMGSDAAFNLKDPRVLEFMGQKLATLVGVNRTMQMRLRSILTEELTQGTNVNDLSEVIRSSFNQWSNGWANVIARTETGIASSGAQAILYKEENVKEVAWQTAGDEAVRESHAEQDGETRPYGSPFSNGLRYPLEIGGPPEEVINCRCVLNAVEVGE